MTLKAVSALSKLDWISLDVEAEGTLDRIDSKLQFTKIVLNATLLIEKDGNEERAIRIMNKAEQNCLVTNSIKTEVYLNSKVKFVKEKITSTNRADFIIASSTVSSLLIKHNFNIASLVTFVPAEDKRGTVPPS